MGSQNDFALMERLHNYKLFDEKEEKYLVHSVKLAAFVMPFTVLPQIYDIWVLKETSGVNIITWMAFLILGLPLFLYMIHRKEWSMVMMYSLFNVFYVVILVGLIV
jgi:uncharacterized protein with PQ loop repeat